MSLTGQNNNISRFSVVDRIGDRFLTVYDLHIFTVSPGHSCFYIINNSLGLLIPWVIRGNDRQICQLSCHLSHFITAKPGAVSSTSEQAYQSVWMIFPQCGQKAFQCHCIMCVIDHQCKVLRHLHHFNTSLYPCHFQSLQDILL